MPKPLNQQQLSQSWHVLFSFQRTSRGKRGFYSTREIPVKQMTLADVARPCRAKREGS
jgi:hypothetical protein